MLGLTIKLHMPTWLIFSFEVSVIWETLYLNFFSALWVAWWLFKLLFVVHLLSQVEHTKGFSPVWVLMWTVSWYLVPKHFRQTSHWWVLSCIFLWLHKVCFEANFLSHTEHSNFFSLPLYVSPTNNIRSYILVLNIRKSFGFFIRHDCLTNSVINTLVFVSQLIYLFYKFSFVCFVRSCFMLKILYKDKLRGKNL